MKLKLLSFFVVFAIFSSTAQTDWTIYKQQDGVNIYMKKSHCDFNMGYDQEWVLFKYENTNNYKVTLIWDLEMYIDNQCQTCNDLNGEYHRVLELAPGESIEGECKIAEDERLHLFSKFEDPNTTMTYTLTDFNFANLNVVNMTE